MVGPRRRRRTGLAFVVALVIALPVRAEGPKAHARAADLEKAARAEFARDGFARAAELFEQANDLAPFPELRYNIALSWDSAGDKPRAADAYERALKLGGLDPERAGASGSRMTALKRELAYVRVVRPLTAVVSVGHLKRAEVPVDVHLLPGRHELVFELPNGTQERKTIEARAGETSTVSVEVPDQKPVVPEQPSAAKREVERDEPPPDKSSLRTWGFVALGTGVVLGGVTAYLGVRTLDEKKKYEDSGLEDLDARDRGMRLRTWTNVALAGAIVSASAGGVLLVLGSGSNASKSDRGFRVRITADRVIGAGTF